MAKRLKTAAVNSPLDAEVRLLALIALCVSVFSFLLYFQRGQVLLYGDAVAHLNIARRVFDSKTPGLLQLGTVWLPLPHLLMIPFLLSHELWQRGVGGSVPSLIAYVLGVIGILRLMRNIFSGRSQPGAAARIAAWAAALTYASNPNLIYMQTTAMGEALYLALFIWAVAFFAEAVRGNPKALTRSGLCLAAACLTRYDGWFLAAAMMATAVFPTLPGKSEKQTPRFSRAMATKFVLIAASAPIFWLAYNAIIYRNPLEFENGPYSAKAIERRSQTSGNPGHPGSGNAAIAGLYFLKSAELNLAENTWLQRICVLLVGIAAISASFYGRQFSPQPSSTNHLWPLAFLFMPLPFYALSVAYSGVPIFIPGWWPFTHYNVRYGLQMLPAFAAAVGVIVYLIARPALSYLRLIFLLAVFTIVAASYISIWRSEPICLEEARINMGNRNRLEAQFASWLQKLPANCTILMYLGDHVGALQQAGIPLEHVINEGNHRVWIRPQDPEGLWERALSDPANFADYIVAFEGDPVWQAVHQRNLKELVEIHVTGQARAVLYRVR